MGWVVGGVWIGAVVFAGVVLLFCGYEVSWKSRRLRDEGERLAALGERARLLEAEAAGLQQRAAQLDRA